MTTIKRKSLVGYAGGKAQIAEYILPYLPRSRIYAEPFAGMLSVMANRDPSEVEIANDFDWRVTMLWKAVRDHPEEMIDAIMSTPVSRAEFARCIDWKNYRHESVVETARRAYVTINQGRRKSLGGQTIKQWDSMSMEIMRFRLSNPMHNKAGIIRLLSHRMRKVRIVHGDYKKVANNLSGKDAVMYCDPPYLSNTMRAGNTMYEGSAAHSLEWHMEFLRTMAQCDCTIAISGYDSPVYDDVLEGWSKIRMLNIHSHMGVRMTSNFSHSGAGHKFKSSYLDRQEEILWVKS